MGIGQESQASSPAAHPIDVERDAGSLFALLGLVRLLTGVILVLMAGLVYTIYKGRPDDRYFAMSFDSRAMPLVGLINPSVNNNALLAWVQQATTQTMTFGFNDVNVKIPVAVEEYFTDVGKARFYEALKKSQILKMLMDQNQLMTAIPGDMPKILYEGLREGRYVWDIQVPIVLTVRAGGKSGTATPKLIVTVIRVPTQKNPAGLGIDQWILM